MNESNQPAKETESIGDAARRLLAKMDERRGPGRLHGPDEFVSAGECPNVPGEKVREGSAIVVMRFTFAGQVTCRGQWGGWRQGSNANVLRAGFHANENAFTSLWLEYDAVLGEDDEWF